MIKTLDDLEGLVTSLAFAPDGRTLLYTWQTGPRLPYGGAILDLESGEEPARFSRHSAAPWACALSPDGAIAASADLRGEIYLWRTADATLVRRLASQGQLTMSAGWSPDGKAIAWGGTTGATQPNGIPPLEHSFNLTSLAFDDTPDNKFSRALASSDSLTIKRKPPTMVAIMKGAEEVSTIDMNVAIGHITFLPRGRVAVATYTGLYLFETRSGRLICTLQGHAGPISGLAPSPDGRFLLSAGADMTLRVWDLAGIEATVASDTNAGIGLSGISDGRPTLQ